MRYGIIPRLFTVEEMTQLDRVVTDAMMAEPFPGDLHPHYKDLRPQRLYSSNIPRSFVDRCKLAAENYARPLNMDEEAYFIYYPKDTLMHPHTDPDPAGDHWRIGLVVRQQCVGGQLMLDGKEITVGMGDVYVFQADVVEHQVTKVESGERVIMTLGLIKPKG